MCREHTLIEGLRAITRYVQTLQFWDMSESGFPIRHPVRNSVAGSSAPTITVQHVSAYTVVRAMCQVNGGWSFSATWGSETPEPIQLKFKDITDASTATHILSFSFCHYMLRPKYFQALLYSFQLGHLQFSNDFYESRIIWLLFSQPC